MIPVIHELVGDAERLVGRAVEELRAKMKGRRILKRLFPILSAYCFLLGLLNLSVGLGFLFLGGQYLLDMFGLIDAPNPKWVGWFVDDLFHMGWSSESCQAVIGAMFILGISLVTTSIDYLRQKLTLARACEVK